MFTAPHPTYLGYSGEKFYFSPNYLLWEQGCSPQGVVASVVAVPSACLMLGRWLKGESFRRVLEKECFKREEMMITKKKVIIRSLKRKSIWYRT